MYINSSVNYKSLLINILVVVHYFEKQLTIISQMTVVQEVVEVMNKPKSYSVQIGSKLGTKVN